MKRLWASIAAQKPSWTVTDTTEVVVFLVKSRLVMTQQGESLHDEKLTDIHSEALRTPLELVSAVVLPIPART